MVSHKEKKLKRIHFEVQGYVPRLSRRLAAPVVILVFLFTLRPGFGQADVDMDRELHEKYRQAREIFREAEGLFQRGDLEQAEAAFEKCTAILPRYADAYYYLARVRYRLGDFPAARRSILTAKTHFRFLGALEVSLAADQADRSGVIRARKKLYGDYFFVHGNILFKLKEYRLSQYQYAKAVKLNPRHPDAYNSLIRLLYTMKDYRRALDYVNRAEAAGVKVDARLKTEVLEAVADSPG